MKTPDDIEQQRIKEQHEEFKKALIKRLQTGMPDLPLTPPEQEAIRKAQRDLGKPVVGMYAGPGHTVQDQVFSAIKADASNLIKSLDGIRARQPTNIEKISMDSLMGQLKKRVDMINKPDFQRVGTGGDWKEQVNSAWEDLERTYADCTQNNKDYRWCVRFVEALRDLMG